jgi:hypothetical protein
VTAPTDLTRGVSLLTGVLAVGLAGACGLLRGPADAWGALVGAGLTLVNFHGLGWAVARAAGAAAGPLGPGRRAAWLGASGLRLGVLGALAGTAVTLGGVGLVGLLLSLGLVPVAVVAVGLAGTRPI